jgi:putative transposase
VFSNRNIRSRDSLCLTNCSGWCWDRFGGDEKGIEPKRTSFRTPWQNGVAERWVGNCRRDLLDHVIVFNERHLKRIMNDYILYYHDDRTHLALEEGTPAGRNAVSKPGAGSKITAMPRLGGLHHRYDLAA